MASGEYGIQSGPNGTGGGWEPSYDLWHYIDVVRRRWWLVLTTVVIAVTAAWWLQRSKLPTFTAEVLLQHRFEESLSPFGIGGGVGGTDVGSHLDLIRSDQVLRPVVDSVGLQLRIDERRNERSRLIADLNVDPGAPEGWYQLVRRGDRLELLRGDDEAPVSEAPVDQPIEGPGFRLTVADPDVLYEPIRFSIVDADVATEALRRQLEIEQGTGFDLIWVRYGAADPQVAAKVVNVTARSYQRQRARTGRELASRRRDVIAQQMVELADSLIEAQDEVQAYLQNTRIVDPEAEGGAMLSSLLQAESEVRQLRFQESLLETVLTGLERGDSGDGLRQLMAMGSDLIPAAPELSRQLRDLQLRRSELTAGRFGRTAADPQVQATDSLIADTRSALRSAAEQSLELLRNRREATARTVADLRAQMGAVPAKTAGYQRVEQKVTAIQDALDRLQDRYYEAQIAEAVETGDIDVVSPARVPLRPDPSRRMLNLISALFAGLLIGGVGAIALDQLDSSIRRPNDAERVAGLQVIGTIPNVRSLESPAVNVGKEAFRTLRTHLRFAPVKQPRVLTVTSPTPRDGKSTVAGNLAMTLMEQGGATLLVDADLRRPQIHTTFGVDLSPGLSDVLQGEVSLKEAVHRSEAHSGLYILSAGTPIPNPTELVGGEEFAGLLNQLRSDFEAVVLDTPPLLAVTDAALIGALSDGTIVVVRAKKTDQQALENAVGQLRRLKVPLLGLVLNGVSMGRHGYSYYPSYTDYSPGETARDREKRPMLKPAGREVTQTED